MWFGLAILLLGGSEVIVVLWCGSCCGDWDFVFLLVAHVLWDGVFSLWCREWVYECFSPSVCCVVCVKEGK